MDNQAKALELFLLYRQFDGLKGGPGSGNWGHAGRPGKRGGSASRSQSTLSSAGRTIGRMQVSESGDKAYRYLASQSVVMRKPTQSEIDNDSKNRAELEKTKEAYKKLKNKMLRDQDAWDDPKQQQKLSDYQTKIKGLMDSIEGTHFKVELLKQDESDNAYYWREANMGVASRLKNEVVTNLANDAGVDYVVANDFIRSWAVTSNGANLTSLRTQEIAHKMFDTEFNEWQQQGTSEKLQKAFEFIKKGDFRGVTDYLNKETRWTTSTAHYAYDNEDSNQFLANKAQTTDMLNSMYDRTQNLLKEAGFKPNDRITLYRGIQGVSTEVGQKYAFKGNALESWSMSKDVANKFAPQSLYEVDTLLAIQVEVKDILSTPFTGFGSLGEGEFVVIGKPGRVAMSIKGEYQEGL